MTIGFPGQIPLGWLNRWLCGSGYARFNDITRKVTKAAVQGFSAIEGRDPVSSRFVFSVV